MIMEGLHVLPIAYLSFNLNLAPILVMEITNYNAENSSLYYAALCFFSVAVSINSQCPKE